MNMDFFKLLGEKIIEEIGEQQFKSEAYINALMKGGNLCMTHKLKALEVMWLEK